MLSQTFKNWLIMSENKKKMFNLDKPLDKPKDGKIVIKLGEVQPDTLFSNRGHMPIKKSIIHDKKVTRGQHKIDLNKDKDYLK
jgi:hypothetical protein